MYKSYRANLVNSAKNSEVKLEGKSEDENPRSIGRFLSQD